MTDDDGPDVQALAEEALESFEDVPPDVEPGPGALVALLRDADRPPEERARAGQLLSHLAERHTAAVADHVPALLDVVAASSGELRRHAARVVVLVLSRLDDRPVPLDAFERQLAADEGDRRRQAASSLSRIAETRAEDLAPLVPHLGARLDDERAEVRRHAIRTLGFVAEADPAAVADLVPAVRRVLDADPPAIVRRDALWLLASVGVDHPELVAPSSEALVDALGSSDPDTRRHAAAAIRTLPEATPEAVDGAIPDLLALLGTEGAYKPAARALVALAEVDPDPVVSGLLTRLESGRPERREHAAWGLALLADEAPELVEPATDRLLEAVDGGSYERVSTNAARAIAGLVRADPDGDLAREVLARLEDDDPMVRRHACLGAGAAARASPREPFVSALVDAFDDESQLVRGVAAGALTEAALAHPAAFRQRTAPFVDLLDAAQPATRAHACVALGAVGGAGERPHLERIRADDPDPEVREVAAEALSDLEARLDG